MIQYCMKGGENMKVVLAFDSFKETLSSLEVANITKEELLKLKKPILKNLRMLII